LNSRDTIVAVSSPPGRALRALIRLSGPQAGSILERLLDRRHPALELRTLVISRLQLAPIPVLAATFPAPHSYTGQDMAELQVPGHPALLDRVVHTAVVLGARPAEPGEFTFRAFLAGKLDLLQAEGIAATIAAVSDSQLHAATLLREGRLGSVAEDLVNVVTDALALVEAGIDFVDQDDVVPIEPEALAQRLARAAAKLDDLLSHSRAWGQLEALPRVVLVGPPNSGKSTLFNALLARRRALTSPIPGTTRDILAEPLTLSVSGREVELLLIDIAGLDQPNTALDRQIQTAARAAIARADLILDIRDASRPPPDPARVPLAACPPVSSPSAVLTIITKAEIRNPNNPLPPGAILVSAHTGLGLSELRSALALRLADRAVGISAQMLALHPRHEQALRDAANQLAQARALLSSSRSSNGSIAGAELIAAALHGALDSLACLGGRMTPDDVLGRIFATFCIGK
jgi:tRNA modification GTPase